MQVYKCDKCGKIIADNEQSIYIRLRPAYQSKEFCATCMKPIAKILKRYKLIK